MNQRFKDFNLVLIQAAFIGLFYFGLLDNGRGPAYPDIMRELKLNNLQGSFLFALTSLMSFLLTILSSFWLKKLKLLQGMKFSWVLLALASFMLALSGTFQSPVLLFLAGFVQGIGMGITGMCMNLMIEAGAPVQYRRRVYGILHAIYGVASFVAPLIFSGFKLLGLKWETFFFFLAFLGPLLLFLPTKGGEDRFSETTPLDNTLPVPLLDLILLGLSVGMYVASEIVVSSRLVLFLEETHHMSNAMASTYLSAFFILLMAGRLCLGIFSIPLKGHTLLLSSLLITGIFTIIGRHTPLFYSLTGLSMSIFFPSFMDWIAESFPKEFQKVTRFSLSGIGLHLVLMHLGFGKVADILGVAEAMNLSTWLTIASLLFLIISLIRKAKRTPIPR